MEVQVIDDNLDFNIQFEKFLKKNDLIQRGVKYNTVAVIGCQSSGKSTLLNLLFDTKFETMDYSKGRGQTTKGIWMAKNIEGSILVFDIEGTDSKERGEQRMTFEQTTSLFALAIADVLLINMWTTDIGRYGASNYGLLRVIFEVNLKLFNQSSAKRLLFVLRDFDDRGNNFQMIKTMLDNDVNNIWREIYKPEAYAQSKPTDFFQFEYAMLPHKQFMEDKFVEECKILRKRFENPEDSLFVTREQTIPMDGLQVFIQKTWEIIRNQKELNLPDQRAMVANYRCNELKDESLELIKPEITDLKKECDHKLVSDFEVKCMNILKMSMAHYEEFASQYEQAVYHKIKKELAAQIIQVLFLAFDSQMKMLRQQTFEKFEKNLKRLIQKDVVSENFYEQTSNLLKETKDAFEKRAATYIIEHSGWGENQAIHEKELEQQLNLLIKNVKEREIEKLHQISQKMTKDRLEQIINEPIYHLKDNFWEEISKPYHDEVEDCVQNCEQILENGFQCEFEEIDDFVQNYKDNIFTFTTEYIKKLFRDINTNLLRRFNLIFKKDQNGKNRDWRDIEEQIIRDMHSKIKKDMDEMISNEFKVIKIQKVQPKKTKDFETPNPDAPLRNTISRSMTINYLKLLSEQDMNRVKDKFNDDVELVLDEAIRKHHNISSTNVPWYFYAIFAFFAYDNVLGWFKNPLFFYPFMTLFSVVFMLYSMGFGPIMIPVARRTANMGLRQMNINFQF